MKTLTRKISIMLMAILAIICMTTGVALGVKTVNASTGTFNITGGELYSRDAHALYTEYIINIDADADVFAGFNNGDEITGAEGFSTIGTHIEHNHDYYGRVMPLANVTLGYRAYKYDVNALKIVIGIPSGYAKLTFNEGLTLGSYSLESKKILYLNEYGVFTETEEDFRPISVYESPDAYLKLVFTTNNYAWFGDSATMPTFVNVLYNGVAVANEDGTTASPCVALGTDWNNGTGAYQSYIYFSSSEFANLNANGGVLVVKEGLQNSVGMTTTDTYGFAIEAGVTHADVSWANLPSWKPIKGFANLSITAGENNVYTLTLTDTKDLLKEDTTADLISNFEKGDDMTDFMKKSSSLYTQMTINWERLSEMEGVSFEKGDANQILMKLPVVATTMFLPANTIVGNAFIGNAIETEVEQNEITVEGVYATHSDGYNNMNNQTSFRVKFNNFESSAISKVEGANLTSYFKSSKFTDYVLINGSTLTSILAQPYRTLNVFYGVKDKADAYPGIYDYQTGDVSDSLEFVLGGMQLFDFDVTIKEGCSFADLKVANSDVTYRKQLDDTFAIYQPETEVRPISVREIPYGDINYRVIYIMFNAKADSANIAAASGKIEFSSNVTINESSSYFSPEHEFGGRYYRMVVNASEYQAFITSENPTITVKSFDVGGANSVETKLVLKNGLFVDENEQVNWEKPTVLEVAHPGNQENDLKLFRIKFSTGLNYFLVSEFLKDNLYMNGEKVFEHTFAAWYANPEYQWDCAYFSVYIDDNIRNYDGGIDVLCIKKGVPLGGGKTTTEDIYFYGVKDLDERDGAWNWKWTYTTEVPDLKILSGGQVNANSTEISATINFDRITNKNDSSLTPEYLSSLSLESVMSKIMLNGKALTEYTDADIAFTENGLTITAQKSEIGDYMMIEILEGFTVPNGYTVGQEKCSIAYGINEGVWAKTFEKTNSLGFGVNDVKSISDIQTIRVGGTASQPIIGKKIAIKFNDKIIGMQARTGTRDDYGDANKIQWLKNITAPYVDLKAMTEMSYAGLLDYVGYEYTPEIMDRFIALGIRDSILDGISINGKTLRELAVLDASAYVQYSVYPISVDYTDGDTLYITIRPESTIYNEIAEGVRLVVNKRIIFETESRTSKSADFVLLADGWKEGVAYVNGITVNNTKNSYYVGQDLDLSMIIAYTLMSDDSQGERITVTADMISGYDKTKTGKQTITVTYKGFTDTFEVNVNETSAPGSSSNPTDDNASDEGGCSGSLLGDSVVIFTSLITVFAVVTRLRKKEN